MKNLFEQEAYQEVISRIESLHPQSQRQWGKMDVAQMLAHCANALEVANGDRELRRGLMGYLFGGMMKKKYVYGTEYRKNDPTDPTFKITDDRVFESEKNRLLQHIHRFHQAGEAGIGSRMHSFFGQMTAKEWAQLSYNHLNHHLNQFGA
ncbi:MAG: DUF1569 domain-containing protein [Flavobacteriales bacterium]|nr:DUF1569 domain-containing protein [Flavobacteriales bacterium]